MSRSPRPDLEALPERVRARAAGYAAQALGALAVEHVPVPLRRVAKFAPRQRARIGGDQILATAMSDEEFRGHLVVQVRAQQPDAVADLEAARVSVGAAALGVLEQADGWQELVDRVAGAEQSALAAAELETARAEVARLREQLAAVESDADARRAKVRAEKAKLREENADLRRKLGESRAAVREAAARAAESAATAERALEERAAETTRADAALRRLREQVATLEGELARLQRTARTDKDNGTLRARLLLDTLLQAGEGLRRELGLPVAHGTPADAVAADLEAEEGSREHTAIRSMRADDPAQVQQLAALPGAHLIVDGYNVTMNLWGEVSLELQRNRLLAGIAPLAAQSGAEVTVVFDGHNAERRPMVQAPRRVRVLFSPQGRIADDVIRDLVAAEPAGRPVGVVTSDKAIVRDVTRQSGVRAIPSVALAALLSR